MNRKKGYRMNYNKRLRPLLWAVPISLIMASCVSNQKFINAQNNIARLKNDSLQLIQAAEVTSEVIEKLNEEKSFYKTELASKKEELKEAQKTIADATYKAALAEHKLNQITEDLEVFNTDFSEVLLENGHVRLVMDQAILFDLGSTSINSLGDRFLKELAGVIKKSEVEVAVQGHTDHVPVVGNDDNWDLSVDRSIAVIQKLTADYGVSPKKLMAAGKSKFDPVVPNDDLAAMAKNRRVEFIIIPDLAIFESRLEDQ